MCLSQMLYVTKVMSLPEVTQPIMAVNPLTTSHFSLSSCVALDYVRSLKIDKCV